MVDVIILYGPTAVGKSAIGIELAKILNGEIISADSMQIYKNLNIGTAKVTEEEKDGIKHHLIDIKEPWEDYSVSDFCQDAKMAIKSIREKGKTPIIVGGTGLYVKALIGGYSLGGVEKNAEFRKSLEFVSNEQIYNEIIQKDSSIQIDKNNRHRLIRQLEKLNFGVSEKNKTFEYSYKLFAICDDRQKIYDRINNRVDKMLQNGVLEEVKYLIKVCKDKDCLATKAIGYKEFFPFINGQQPLVQCAEILKQKTRNYAKRQFTFMNQFRELTKVNFIGINETANKIKDILNEK